MKKWWNKKTKEQKKWFLIKVISSLVFLMFGLVFGIIALYANGWDFVKFITNPTVDLILLVLITLIVFCLSFRTERRE